MVKQAAAMVMATAMLVAFAAQRGPAADNKPKPPYYVSIAASQARMRTGPGRTYPASWLYVRPDLPLRVVAVYKEWRKVEDPDGTEGWMLGALLSTRRTAIVTHGIADLRDRPDPAAHIAWHAEPGVVGRLSECGGGWCKLDVRGQSGFVELAHLWGVEGDEELP